VERKKLANGNFAQCRRLAVALNVRD